MATRSPLALALAAGALLLAAAPVRAQSAGVDAAYVPARPVGIAAPADLGPDPATLRPGLAASQVETWYEFGRPRGGRRADGGVLQTYVPVDAGVSPVTGYIRFDFPGDYRLRVLDGDAVRLTLAGLSIYESAGRQPGGISPPLPLRILSAGWYPIAIVAGGGARALQWQTPDRPDAWAGVPEAALAH